MQEISGGSAGDSKIEDHEGVDSRFGVLSEN